MMSLLTGALSPTLAASFILSLFLSLLVYRRYLSPLSKVPGPALASVTRLWHMYYIWTGRQADKILSLHEEFGELRLCSPMPNPKNSFRKP